MTDDLDPALRRRLDALAEAVPENTGAAEPGGVVVRGRDQGLPGASLMGVAAIVAAGVLLGVVYLSAGGTPHPNVPAKPGQASAAVVGESPSPTASAPRSFSPSPTSTPSPRMTRPPADVPLPYPDGCAAYGLSPKRCAYIANWAIQQAGADPQTATLELLGDPRCPTECATLGAHFVVRVRVTSPDSSWHDESVSCFGIGGQSSWLCADPPRIAVYDPIHGGYWDVPCGNGPGPGGCATPPPSVTPAAAQKAVPLQIAQLTVPIDHTGAYSIDLGDAVLANGVLREVSATLADDARPDLSIPDPIRVEVIGEDGKPIQNVYSHPWHPGTEPVHVRLVFTVEAFDAPTTLDLTNIVVR